MAFSRVQVRREVCELFVGDVEDHCKKGLGEWTLVTLKSLEMATGRRVSARARSSCLHILIDDHRMWLSRLHIHHTYTILGL